MVALAAGILARPPPSTSGPGRHPFKVVARVRIPLGALLHASLSRRQYVAERAVCGDDVEGSVAALLCRLTRSRDREGEPAGAAEERARDRERQRRAIGHDREA